MPLEEIMPQHVDALFRRVMLKRFQQNSAEVFQRATKVEFDPTNGSWVLWTTLSTTEPTMTSEVYAEGIALELCPELEELEESVREQKIKKARDDLHDNYLLLYNAFKRKMFDVYYTFNIKPEEVSGFTIEERYASPETLPSLDMYISGMGPNILRAIRDVLGEHLSDNEKMMVEPLFLPASDPRAPRGVPMVPGIPFDTPPALQMVTMLARSIQSGSFSGN